MPTRNVTRKGITCVLLHVVQLFVKNYFLERRENSTSDVKLSDMGHPIHCARKFLWCLGWLLRLCGSGGLRAFFCLRGGGVGWCGRASWAGKSCRRRATCWRG